MHLFDGVPAGLTNDQRDAVEIDLRRMACMMVHWFSDRAFTCPDSLAETIETYKNLVTLNVHAAQPAN